jgi:hypothetical protein
MHNYKLIRYPLKSGEMSPLDSSSAGSGYTRFDELLLEMVDLVRDRWGFIKTEQFGLTGYSGGAQVSHHHHLLYHSDHRADCSSYIASSTYTHLGSHSYQQEHREQLPPYHPHSHGHGAYPTHQPYSAKKSIYPVWEVHQHI